MKVSSRAACARATPIASAANYNKIRFARRTRSVRRRRNVVQHPGASTALAAGCSCHQEQPYPNDDGSDGSRDALTGRRQPATRPRSTNRAHPSCGLELDERALDRALTGPQCQRLLHRATAPLTQGEIHMNAGPLSSPRGFQRDQMQRLLCPVGHTRNTERSLPAIALWNIDSPQWSRRVSTPATSPLRAAAADYRSERFQPPPRALIRSTPAVRRRLLRSTVVFSLPSSAVWTVMTLR